MNFLKKGLIPFIVLVCIGAASCIISVACFIVPMPEFLAIGIIMMMIGSIFIGSGSYIIGRISSFISIEKTTSKHRNELKRQSGASI